MKPMYSTQQHTLLHSVWQVDSVVTELTLLCFTHALTDYTTEFKRIIIIYVLVIVLICHYSANVEAQLCPPQ